MEKFETRKNLKIETLKNLKQFQLSIIIKNVFFEDFNQKLSGCENFISIVKVNAFNVNLLWKNRQVIVRSWQKLGNKTPSLPWELNF